MGNDFLSQVGLKPDPVTKTINWFDHAIPWKQYSDLPKVKFCIMQSLLLEAEEQNDLLESHVIQKGPVQITESKYTKVDPDFVAAQQTHLSPTQQAELAALLRKFPKLFSGELGKYLGKKVHLDLIPGAKPVHKRPYAVANAHHTTFYQELQ